MYRHWYRLHLEKAIKICTAGDSTRRQIESFRPNLANRTQSEPTVDQREVHKFNARCSPPKRTSFKHKYIESTQSTKSNNSKCFFCGGPQAHKDRFKFPAVNKECHTCKIIGHFNRVCKNPECHPRLHNKHKSNTYKSVSVCQPNQGIHSLHPRIHSRLLHITSRGTD